MRQKTDWFNIEVWGPMTKFAATLKKGDPVIVEGKLIPRRYKVEEIEHFALSIRANALRKIDYNQSVVTDEPNDAAQTPRTPLSRGVGGPPPNSR